MQQAFKPLGGSNRMSYSLLRTSSDDTHKHHLKPILDFKNKTKYEKQNTSFRVSSKKHLTNYSKYTTQRMIKYHSSSKTIIESIPASNFNPLVI